MLLLYYHDVLLLLLLRPYSPAGRTSAQARRLSSPRRETPIARQLEADFAALKDSGCRHSSRAAVAGAEVLAVLAALAAAAPPPPPLPTLPRARARRQTRM